MSPVGQSVPFKRYQARLRAGEVGYFQFGEAWFHVDIAASREAEIPPYLAACHEDAHRRTQFRKFAYFQQFLSFAGLAAQRAGNEVVRARVEQLQSAAITASAYTQEGCASVNMLMRCFPNYARHFDRLYELFSSIEPYATGLKLCEALLGPLPDIVKRETDELGSLLQATEYAVSSITGLALDNTVLRIFRDLEQLTVEKWRDYLESEGPDVRLQKLVDQMAPRLKSCDLSLRYLAELRAAEVKYQYTLEGQPGTEHIFDDLAVDADRAFVSWLRTEFGAFGMEVVYQYSTDPAEWTFAPEWFASIDRLLPEDRGFRVAWLDSTFGRNFAADADGNARFIGPGRLFRLAAPAKWIAFEKLSLCLVGKKPGLWARINEISKDADRRGFVLAISFAISTEENAVGVIVTQWKTGPGTFEASVAFREAYHLDGSIAERPSKPRQGKHPWIIHADGYVHSAPIIQQFLRPGDLSLVSLNVLDTYTVARLLDQATLAGRNPVFLPSVSKPPVNEPGSPPSGGIPSSWLFYGIADEGWRWTMYPGYLDAMEHVILERQTLTQMEKAERLVALNDVIQKIDQLGPEEGLRAGAFGLSQAVGVPPRELWPELQLMAGIGRRLAFVPDLILGSDMIVVPENRVRPYGEPALSTLEARYRSFLPPPQSRQS
jgi:hypothetical protein